MLLWNAVHLLYTAEKVRPEYPLPSPDVDPADPADEAGEYRVISFEGLLQMELNAYH